MLFHVSIEADRPAHVAAVLAELWQGKALPFPPVAVGSWVAFADDAAGTVVEVYPRGIELHEAAGDADAAAVAGTRRHHGATHLAMATPLPVERLLAIAAREEWPAKLCRRGGMFDVIEMWVEGCQMVELLTPEMQAEYRRTMTVAGWERMLGDLAPSLAA